MIREQDTTERTVCDACGKYDASGLIGGAAICRRCYAMRREEAGAAPIHHPVERWPGTLALMYVLRGQADDAGAYLGGLAPEQLAGLFRAVRELETLVIEALVAGKAGHDA